MSQLLDKLRKVAQYSDGIFITGQIISGEKENKYFNNFFQRNPYYFEIIDISKTKILRLTQLFNNHYLTPRPVKKINGPTQILQRILWSGMIMQEPLAQEIPDLFFKWGKYRFILDPFQDDDIKVLKARHKENLFHGVITIIPRVELFRAADLWAIVPITCKKRWVKAHLSLFYQRNFSDCSPMAHINPETNNGKISPQNEIFDRFLIGGIWPENVQQCHHERKHYPGHNLPLTGEEKWEMDKAFLELGKSFPENYYLGVYP